MALRRRPFPPARTPPFVRRRPQPKGRVPAMAPAEPQSDCPDRFHDDRASRLIAESLVKRHAPSRILMRAKRLGLSPELTRAVVVACSAAAIEPREQRGIASSH